MRTTFKIFQNVGCLANINISHNENRKVLGYFYLFKFLIILLWNLEMFPSNDKLTKFFVIPLILFAI